MSPPGRSGSGTAGDNNWREKPFRPTTRWIWRRVLGLTDAPQRVWSSAAGRLSAAVHDIPVVLEHVFHAVRRLSDCGGEVLLPPVQWTTNTWSGQPSPRSGCPGTTARRWSRLAYDGSCMAEKDTLWPGGNVTRKWPESGPLTRQNRKGFWARHGNRRKCCAPIWILHGRKGYSLARRERHSKMAGKRTSDQAKSQRVLGQARKPSKMLRAGLYARVSTNDQQTIPLQIRALREYTARRGWTIALQVKEVGSGASQRQLREKLLDAARRREIDVVLVWRLDRWGRSVADLLATLQELE